MIAAVRFEDKLRARPRLVFDGSETVEITLPERDALADAVEALREVRDLAGVAHNGDPWYAEHEGLDGEAILRRANEALARLDGAA